MDYRSTRGGEPVCIEQAIMSGTAPDGGLYVPEALPDLGIRSFDGAAAFPDIACRLLEPFVAGSTLAPDVGAVCGEALNFPVPTRQVETGLSFSRCFTDQRRRSRMWAPDSWRRRCRASFADGRYARPPVTIIVATSGDTGGGGRGGISPATGHSRDRAVPGWTGVAATATPADVLGRQRHFAGGAR